MKEGVNPHMMSKEQEKAAQERITRAKREKTIETFQNNTS